MDDKSERDDNDEAYDMEEEEEAEAEDDEIKDVRVDWRAMYVDSFVSFRMVPNNWLISFNIPEDAGVENGALLAWFVMDHEEEEFGNVKDDDDDDNDVTNGIGEYILPSNKPK